MADDFTGVFIYLYTLRIRLYVLRRNNYTNQSYDLGMGFLTINPTPSGRVWILRDMDIYLSIYLSIYLCIYLSIYLSICLSVCLSVYRSIYLSIYLSACLSVCLSIDLSIYLSICLSVCLSVCLSIDRSIYLSIYLYLSIFNLRPQNHEKQTNASYNPKK